MKELYAVGIGPGSYEQMTVQAVRTLEKSDVIIGYTVYVDLVREHFPGREFLSTPMRQEEERCRMAFEEAEKGKTVSMVCSGDPGVYGMAGLLCGIGREHPDVELTVIPGVTAATSGAALLGAPLVQDFCVVSLSDLLVPWEKIESRLRAAAESGMAVVLYNPSSRKRAGHLNRACGILLETLPEETICGLARNIGREGESCRILTLSELKDAQTDMFTTVFIGTPETEQIGERMATPRGYQNRMKTEDESESAEWKMDG